MSKEQDDTKIIDELKEVYQNITDEVAKVIHGQKDVVEKILISIFSKGHSLLMGVPGLAKTLTIQTIAQTMALDFSRIQFTPDLMPSDITGTEILQENEGGKRNFQFIKGPVFANIVLADEINRTSAKTQAALLEAMQEHKVTVVGKTYQLEQPFFVLATQNPIEQEGTYPLPEAQLDRFMFFIEVEYPTREEELEVARKTTGGSKPSLNAVVTGEQIIKYQELVRRMPVPDHIYDYIVDLVRYTRPIESEVEWVKECIAWGAGPRAVQNLILAAKSHAALYGNYMVSMENIEAICQAVLVHRLQLTFRAESQAMTSKEVVKRLIEDVKKLK